SSSGTIVVIVRFKACSVLIPVISSRNPSQVRTTRSVSVVNTPKSGRAEDMALAFPAGGRPEPVHSFRDVASRRKGGMRSGVVGRPSVPTASPGPAEERGQGAGAPQQIVAAAARSPDAAGVAFSDFTNLPERSEQRGRYRRVFSVRARDQLDLLRR